MLVSVFESNACLPSIRLLCAMFLHNSKFALANLYRVRKMRENSFSFRLLRAQNNCINLLFVLVYNGCCAPIHSLFDYLIKWKADAFCWKCTGFHCTNNGQNNFETMRSKFNLFRCLYKIYHFAVNRRHCSMPQKIHFSSKASIIRPTNGRTRIILTECVCSVKY